MGEGFRVRRGKWKLIKRSEEVAICPKFKTDFDTEREITID